MSQKRPICRHEECTKRASYGYKDNKNIRCREHKLVDMFDTTHKLCEIKECNKIPCMGFPEIGKKVRCAEHSEKGMINLISKRCQEKECNKIAHFGYIFRKPLRCKKHILKDMKDVEHKLCEYPDCPIQATFSFPNKSISRCSKHQLEGMIPKNKRKCEIENCKIQPSYAFSADNRPRRCRKHIEKGMIDISSKICKEDDCRTQASYGFDTKEYCAKHKKVGMELQAKGRKCSDCKLYIVKKGNKCSYCDPKSSKRQKTKENEVIKFLTENNISFISNKQTEGNCGRYKPDILIDANTHYIVAEIDEQQHKYYDKSCELIRMNNIYLSNGLPTVFIRYNPDTYQRNGITKRIFKSKRLANLLEQIEYHTQHIPSSPLSFVYLYYDCKCEMCDGIHDNTEDMIENFKELILS